MTRRWTPEPLAEEPAALLKPFLRGWSHALAAVAAAAITAALAWQSRDDVPRAISMLVFGLAMIELYVVSAVYHIGRWRGRTRRVLRALDHANIFVLIAGTYTPICFNVLSGATRVAILVATWSLAIAGCMLSAFTERVPRWTRAGLYLGMGWIAVLTLPMFVELLRWPAVAMLLAGGALYTCGAIVYGLKRPDPFPRVFGFHEIFHLFVISGSAAFVAVVWIWVLHFPRI
ncbi:MAG TPA: hemolysin III family protein [Candidatus Binatia bacterium]|nr:hemolysin III family protein [Candidatus Binatia bacterium]